MRALIYSFPFKKKAHPFFFFFFKVMSRINERASTKKVFSGLKGKKKDEKKSPAVVDYEI